jgi:hypothetical protein
MSVRSVLPVGIVADPVSIEPPVWMDSPEAMVEAPVVPMVLLMPPVPAEAERRSKSEPPVPEPVP